MDKLTAKLLEAKGYDVSQMVRDRGMTDAFYRNDCYRHLAEFPAAPFMAAYINGFVDEILRLNAQAKFLAKYGG